MRQTKPKTKSKTKKSAKNNASSTDIYIVTKTMSDYDSGAPVVEIVSEQAFHTKADAFAALLDDMDKELEEGGVLDVGRPLKPNNFQHKCALGYMVVDDGADTNLLWNIETLQLSGSPKTKT